MQAVNNEVVEDLTHYFEPRRPLDVNALMPKEIAPPKAPPRVKKPKLPKQIEFVQGKYEPKDEYEARVNRLTQKYNAEVEEQRRWYISAVESRNQRIERKNADYKKKVEERNHQVLLLQERVNNDYKKIEKEQKEKKHKVESRLSIFYKNAFKKYYQNPKILSTDYFVNDEIMRVKLGSSVDNFTETLEFKMPAHDAQKFDQSLPKVKTYVHFKVKSDIDKRDISIGLDHVVFKLNGEEYVASLSRAERKRYMLKNSIKLKKTAEIKQSEKMLALQNANKGIATQNIKTESYEFAVQTNTKNDILDDLKAQKSAKIKKSNWLLVVGIEKYLNTDDISYSRKSAETYTKVIQKLMGVSEGHTMSIVDEGATSAQLKHKIDAILSRVKKGDTIYFYYSGHGVPVPSEKNEPYMLPSDVYPASIQEYSYFKLKNLYKKLTDSKAGKVVAVVDSCFSGSTDGVSNIKGVAATVLVPKKVSSYDKKRMVIIAAGKDSQYSNKFDEKQQRLFSYYIMRALLDKKRKVNSVYSDAEEKVEETSQDVKGLSKQTPVVMGNSKLSF